MVKALIFDFDGVIVDSEPLHYRAFVEIAQRFEVAFSYDDYLRKYIGYDDRDFWSFFLRDEVKLPDDAADATLITKLCRAKGDAFERIVRQGVEPMPGAVKLIDEARQAIPIAIGSGATMADIELILTGLGLRDRFEVIVTADDVSRSKPDPTTYQLAWQRVAAKHPNLGLLPGDCVVIEDTAAGIASAKAAGMQVLGLTSTTPADQLHEADRVVDSLTEVTVATLQQWLGR